VKGAVQAGRPLLILAVHKKKREEGGTAGGERGGRSFPGGLLRGRNRNLKQKTISYDSHSFRKDGGKKKKRQGGEKGKKKVPITILSFFTGPGCVQKERSGTRGRLLKGRTRVGGNGRNNKKVIMDGTPKTPRESAAFLKMGARKRGGKDRGPNTEEKETCLGVRRESLRGVRA